MWLFKYFPPHLRGTVIFNLINYKIIKIATSNNHSLFLTLDGKVLACGNNNYGQLGLGHNDNINKFTKIGIKAKSISCGDFYIFVIDEEE